MGIAVVAAVLAAAVVAATPASANVIHAYCPNAGAFTPCIVLEIGPNFKTVRAVGSLQDHTSGADVVAVAVRLWHYPGPDLAATGPAALANDYALTATPWVKCQAGTYWAHLTYTYKGERSGDIFAPAEGRIAVC
jgi:hypothetical protein